MKLTFLGTRGYIRASSPRHRRHTALLAAYRGRRVMIDCGEDWRGLIAEVGPHAIVLTHAHPDHAFGLDRGAPCPVWATGDAWETIKGYPIAERHVVSPRTPVAVEGIGFEAFPVEHSVRAPAVGYRVGAGRAVVFYVPDVIYIHERETALAGAQIFIGDGATLSRPLVRRRGERLIGHALVRTQLTWCKEAGIPRAIITHCGNEIVSGEPAEIQAQLRAMAEERGVHAELAHDGMTVVLR